jgi:hypothetical protein
VSIPAMKITGARTPEGFAEKAVAAVELGF